MADIMIISRQCLEENHKRCKFSSIIHRYRVVKSLYKLYKKLFTKNEFQFGGPACNCTCHSTEPDFTPDQQLLDLVDKV